MTFDEVELLNKELCEKLNRVYLKFFPKDRPFTVEVDTESWEWTISSESSVYSIWNDLNTAFVDIMSDWYLHEEICHPGVHTFSNGDPGYPDEYEYKDIGSYTYPWDLIRDIVKKTFLENLGCVIEDIAMDEQFKAIQERVEKEYDKNGQ